MSRSNSNPEQTPSAELKLCQVFIFSVPIFFIFILLFSFYLFYLRRRRRGDWLLIWMRASLPDTDDGPRFELGLKKEHREMLPIVVFKESFFVKDTICSVCLGDYQPDDRLQQIPACGHTFHMDCIDLWLATHTTCPLCRLSLIASAKASSQPSNTPETSNTTSLAQNIDETSRHFGHQPCEETCISPEISHSRNGGERVLYMTDG